VSRWARLAAAAVAISMIANLQYGWTMFVKPIMAGTGWKLSEVQLGFTLFIAVETWAMPLAGWLVGRYSTRVLVFAAGLLCGAGWGALGHAQTVMGLYAEYSVAGFGASIIYCSCMAVALRCFPDRRGLAAGIIAAGFGSGTAMWSPLIAHAIGAFGYRTAFAITGLAQGLVILGVAPFLPRGAHGRGTRRASPASGSQSVEFSPREMLRTEQFYILYLMMLMMGIGGLMVTAQMGPVAASLAAGSTATAALLSSNSLANGVGRIFWGSISDVLGRERTMALAFFLHAICLIGAPAVGRFSKWGLVAALGLVFFTWGGVYVLFPAQTADLFGGRNANSNYSLLYSAKGGASILAGVVAARIYERTANWDALFYGTAILAVCSALLAIRLLRMPRPRKIEGMMEILPVTPPGPRRLAVYAGRAKAKSSAVEPAG
jgi:OFA family oxalate/formate antiporter-like MFS transporter